jgi:hypothetical protein
VEASRTTACGGLWIQTWSNNSMSRALTKATPQESYKILRRQQLLLKMEQRLECQGNLCRKGQWKHSHSYRRHQQCGGGTLTSSTPIVLCALHLGRPAIQDPDQVTNRICLCRPRPDLSAHDQAPVQVIKEKQYPLTSMRPTLSNLQNHLSRMNPH